MRHEPLTFVILLLVHGVVAGQQSTAPSMKVLFIGNSYTWARKHIPEMLEGADPVKLPKYAQAMFRIAGNSNTADLKEWCQQQKVGLEGGLSGAYSDIAKELEAVVAPVGVAWKMALAADSSLALHRPDRSHPNPTGTYLTACVFFGTLLRETPVGLPGEVKRDDTLLVSIRAEQARRLQQIAWDAVQNAKLAPERGNGKQTR